VPAADPADHQTSRFIEGLRRDRDQGRIVSERPGFDEVDAVSRFLMMARKNSCPSPLLEEDLRIHAGLLENGAQVPSGTSPGWLGIVVKRPVAGSCQIS
jgi:hypothetical protein